jgi:hypothetical protein
MTWIETLAPVHNTFYAVLPIIFWIYVFVFTRKKACTEKQTTFIMAVLAFLIVFISLDIAYCSILLNEPTFKNDPNYTSIRISIIVSLVMAVLGVAMSLLNLFAIYRGTYCSTVDTLANKASVYTARARSAAGEAKGRVSRAYGELRGKTSPPPSNPSSPTSA